MLDTEQDDSRTKGLIPVISAEGDMTEAMGISLSIELDPSHERQAGLITRPRQPLPQTPLNSSTSQDYQIQRDLPWLKIRHL